MATDATGRESDKFMLRLPDGMRDRLKGAAEANKRSMNAEIVARLESSFDVDAVFGSVSGLTLDGKDVTNFISAKIDDLAASVERAAALADQDRKDRAERDAILSRALSIMAADATESSEEKKRRIEVLRDALRALAEQEESDRTRSDRLAEAMGVIDEDTPTHQARQGTRGEMLDLGDDRGEKDNRVPGPSRKTRKLDL